MKIPTKIAETVTKVNRTVGKNAPILLTVVGVVGFGATAVLSYKASKKVELIVEDIEASNEKAKEISGLEEELNNHEVRLSDAEFDALQAKVAELQESYIPYTRAAIVRDMAGALALPVVTGVASVCAIGLSYYIQNNRIVNLAAAVATSSAENVYFRKKYKEVHGEEAYNKFHHMEEEVRELVDKKGNVKEKEVPVAKDYGVTIREGWYDHSSHYASDDHDYNMAYIRSVSEALETRLFRMGTLTLNEVYEALGFPRTKQGAILGWHIDGFNLDTQIMHVHNKETSTIEPQILVEWTQPTYIYDTIEYELFAGQL